MKEKSKKWYESKTVLFNILTTVILIASFTSELDPQFGAVSVAITGIGNIVLRIWFTEAGVSKSFK